MYKVGITGGIATGKSTVMKYLQKKGYPVIDCDILAKEALERDTPAYKAVVHKFGSGIKQRDAEIDRKKLAQIIFNNESKRKLLERIVHEQVLRDVQSQLRDYSNSKELLVFIDIPLLFEVKWEFLVDETWVIACDEQTQIKRLMNRDDLSEEDAQSRLNAQIPIEDKKSLGDVLIDSNQSIEEMYSDVDKELKRLNELVSL